MKSENLKWNKIFFADRSGTWTNLKKTSSSFAAICDYLPLSVSSEISIIVEASSRSTTIRSSVSVSRLASSCLTLKLGPASGST